MIKQPTLMISNENRLILCHLLKNTKYTYLTFHFTDIIHMLYTQVNYYVNTKLNKVTKFSFFLFLFYAVVSFFGYSDYWYGMDQ